MSEKHTPEYITINAKDIIPIDRATVIATLCEIDQYLCKVSAGLLHKGADHEALGISFWVLMIREAVNMLEEDERSEDDGK